ncbi:MAG: nucleotidyl transferase AbiEii/AbiGii toxin family protein [Acidobacteriaceae bacterium]
MERLLFRISQSEHRRAFILKGALLFELWTEQTHRPTRDADFLSIGSSGPGRFEDIFKEICVLPVVDDGVTFDPSSVIARQIKEGADYEGVRVSFLGYLEKARIPMQLDIGFGDAVTPSAIETAFPTILDGPAAVLLTYPKETVVAEKFEAMVKLGIANTRMKDFHDLYSLSRLFSFEGQILSDAIVRTFERRKTRLPSSLPIAFTAEFFEDESKQRQWTAFNRKNKLYIESVPLQTVVSDIEQFVMPIVHGVAMEVRWSRSWRAGGPWQD